jgi:hypothetical protein
VQALDWVQYSLRLERLPETEKVLVVEVYVELQEGFTGTLSGVPSVISTSLVMF